MRIRIVSKRILFHLFTRGELMNTLNEHGLWAVGQITTSVFQDDFFLAYLIGYVFQIILT